jgi:hypothetical protein
MMRSRLPLESRIRISLEGKLAASGVVNRLLLTQEHRLNSRRLIHLPAVSIWSNFDDRHDNNCILLQASLSVRLNMTEPNNGQTLTAHNSEAAQGFTAVSG